MSPLSRLSYLHKTFLPALHQFNTVNIIAVKGSSNQTLRQISTSGISLSKLYFTKKHEWVAVDNEETHGTIGISNHAQEALGDVVFVQLPEVNDKVVKGEECGALESVKAASELFSPVSGTVTEKNDAAEKVPSIINASAQDEGWLFKVKLSDSRELSELMDDEAYEAFLKTEEAEGH